MGKKNSKPNQPMNKYKKIVEQYHNADKAIVQARIDKADAVKKFLIEGVGYEEMAKLIGTCTYQNLEGFYKRYGKLKNKNSKT